MGSNEGMKEREEGVGGKRRKGRGSGENGKEDRKNGREGERRR